MYARSMAWLTNEMSKAQNLVQENSRLLMNAPHARIAFLPFFALKMVFFPLLCPLTVFSHLLAFLAHSGWTVGQLFFDLGTALFSRYREQCHNQTNLRTSCLQRFRSCQEKRKKVTKTCTNIMLGAMQILPGSVSQMCQLSTPCVVAANSRHTITNVEKITNELLSITRMSCLQNHV